jgi:hypothetical protein
MACDKIGAKKRGDYKQTPRYKVMAKSHFCTALTIDSYGSVNAIAFTSENVQQ